MNPTTFPKSCMLKMAAAAIVISYSFSSVYACQDNDSANSQDHNETSISKSVGQCTVNSRADILLITSAELFDSWNQLANWKTSTGRPLKRITVQEINKAYEGRDTQEKIRLCCLDHIEHQQTRWVILGGDSRGTKGGHVPDRDTHHVEFFKYKNIPTDIYYLSDGDWDANDDGIYGKFSEDMDAVNYVHPTACIGRIPVRTREDVAAYTDKVIQYESNYPTGDFARQMIYTCAEQHANPKLHTSKDKITECWDQCQIEQFFVNKTPWDSSSEGDHDLTPANWVEMINSRQASKLHMHGHGLNNLWVLENRTTVTSETIQKLTNKNAYPVMTTVSCFTGQFDSFKDPCITESMLRQESGGAIAIIAPSREGIPVFHKHSDFQLMMSEGKMDGTTESLTRFWRHALENNTTIGEAFRQAKMDMESHARKTAGYHFVQCELNLLGDPTLDTRANPVTSLDCSAKRIGTDKVAVDGVEKDCQICLWDGNEFFHIKSATSDGEVEFTIPSSAAKSLRISVFGPDRNTWTASLGESQ